MHSYPETGVGEVTALLLRVPHASRNTYMQANFLTWIKSDKSEKSIVSCCTKVATGSKWTVLQDLMKQMEDFGTESWSN